MGQPINATGIIWQEQLHKPPLPTGARKALQGEPVLPPEDRGPGGAGAWHELPAEELLAVLTEAEDALVVNNIFAAAYLVFTALAKGRKVLAYGNELQLEGYAPLLGTLAKKGGAQLQKIGAFPALELEEEARAADAGLLMGLYGAGEPASGEEEASCEALLAAGGPQARGIPVVKVLENATLVDLSPYGLRSGLLVQQSLQEGFDLVIFAGDRLVGGPPAGLIVGRSRCISQLRREPLAAALSPDRLITAALGETLKLYFNEEEALREIPLLRQIATPADELEARAHSLAGEIERESEGLIEARVVCGESPVRGNDRSVGLLPSFQVELTSPRFPARQLFEMMCRHCRPPVLPRLSKNSLLLDLRTVEAEEDAVLVDALKHLFAEKGREESLLDSVPALIWVLDEKWTFLYANRACERFWGVEPGGLAGKPLREAIPGDTQPLEEAMTQVLEEGTERRFEFPAQPYGAGTRWLDVMLTQVVGEHGGVTGVAFTAYDITHRKDTEEELKYISMHDNLTGLYNRVYFEEEMRRLDTQRHYPISIVVCDVDGLKLINDILGHEKGDELLKTAASIIRKPFRDSDVVARVGGDEFAVILPSTGEETAEQISGRIKTAVKEFNKRQPGLPINISVGYDTAQVPGELSETFKKADANMYKDKFKRTEVVKKEIMDALLSMMSQKAFMDEKEAGRLERMIMLLGRSVGIEEEEMENMLLLARVHDIGKVGIDDRIIYKQGALSSPEWEEVRKHPETGYRIALSSPEMQPVADYILQHHERWDGRGYPKGLKGPEIHLYSRIMAIIDAYHAMTSPRPYRQQPLSHEEAVQELIRMKGVQFDPRLVDIFVSLVEEINALREEQ